MTDYFATLGRALISHGYLVIPIKPGHKRPALGSWQTARLGAADLARYPDHGVGVLCGQGAQPIAAIDVDTTDEGLAQAFLAWCYEHLGVTCERVGKAPKVLLVSQPTWGVDVGAAAQIRGELLKLRDAGCAVLVVSEELDELFEVSDRLMVMAQGRLSPSIPAAEATVEQIGAWMSGLWDGGAGEALAAVPGLVTQQGGAHVQA